MRNGGVIYPDLKPGNILLDKTRPTSVLDLRVARVDAGSSAHFKGP